MQNVIDRDVTFDPAAIAATLIGARGADIADTLDRYDSDEAAAIVAHLPLDEAVKALDQPGIDDAGQIVALLRAVRRSS